jgi:hypothetical protein
MRKPGSLGAAILACMILVPTYLSLTFTKASAQNGSANLYILALTDVPCHEFDTEPPSNDARDQCKNGAIAAITFHEDDSLPFVHPKYGPSPPFYATNPTNLFYVITNWASYADVVEHQSNAIIVNCHGEILPVPSTFSAQSWMGVIADAVLNRSIVWVHSGGYPFYYAWYQGASQSTLWGGFGFQNFTQYIGIDGATCSLPEGDDETTQVQLTDWPRNMLQIGGFGLSLDACKAELGRPLNTVTFKNFTVTNIWQPYTDYAGNTLTTGAVISFVKPSQRFSIDQHKGFGAYVHIGTRNVYDSSGHSFVDSNFMRGYVGCVVALVQVVQRFTPLTAYDNFTEDGGGYSEIGAIVTPVIAGWNRVVPDSQHHENDYWLVDVDYALYCCLKTNGSADINEVDFQASSDYYSQMCIMPNASLSAHDNFHATLNVLKATAFLAIDAVVLLAPVPEPGTKLAAIVDLLNGVQLFSDIYDLTDSILGLFPDSGYADYASFNFNPAVSSQSKGGFTFYEFESSVRVEFKVGFGNFNAWSVFPLNTNVAIPWSTSYQQHYLFLCSDSDFCYHYPAYDAGSLANTTIFFDDFQEGLNSWTFGDNNPAAGLDYWGIYTGNGGNEEPCVYCAEVGNNSVFGDTPNMNLGQSPTGGSPMGMYDKDMDATLTLNLDLSPYQRAWLRFSTVYSIGGGDYLAVEKHGTGWTTLATYTQGGGASPTFELPRITTSIRFEFYSNDDNDVGQSYALMSGALIYYVEIFGELPNDAINTGQDAGQSPAAGLPISSSGMYKGYLEYDLDWYNFTITTSDISNKRMISVYMYPPTNSIFTMNLTNPSGTLKAGPSAQLIYVLKSADVAGIWHLGIQANEGFGQYRFDISVSGGGGGCPYVYDWNGSGFVKDNNILPASENGNGTDAKDYYLLQQRLVPVISTQLASLYCLQVREFENEQDYIDQVKLMAVDHGQGTSVAVTQRGEIFAYADPAAPLLCSDNNGISRLSEIGRMDGNVSNPATYFQGNKGDWLLLDFGSVTGAHANLILRDDMKCAECIDVQVPSANGGWQTVEVLNPRDFWSMEAVNMTAYLPANGDFVVRLLWTQTHRLDYVGLDSSSQAQVLVNSAPPVLAVHSTLGDVKAKLLYDDGNCVELVNGQQVMLAFVLPNKAQGTARDFILYTDGYYYTITP